MGGRVGVVGWLGEGVFVTSFVVCSLWRVLPVGVLLLLVYMLVVDGVM